MLSAQLAILLLASAIALYFNALFIGLFLAEVFGHRSDNTSSDADKTQMLRAITALALVFSIVPYAAWETNYGSAFSYFWPLHGIGRIGDFTWRVGIFVKAFFIASLVSLLTTLIMHSNDGDAATNRQNFSIVTTVAAAADSTLENDASLPILSRLSYVDALLVPTCIAFPLIALLIYTAIPNITNKIKS